MATKSAAVRLHSAGGMQGAQSRIRHLRTKLACGPRGPAPRHLIVSSLLFFAAVSRALVAIERSGNAQLTIDDAILYDYGMRMGRLAFDFDGNRIARESNVTEREAVRRYNWLVRKDKEIPVRAELAELTKQIGAWPAARTVE